MPLGRLPPEPLRVLLIEPYLTGSHRAWAEGYQASTRHDLRLLSMPGRFWKWRMHGAALSIARQLHALVGSGWQPEVLLVSDMIDLAGLLGLVRDRLTSVPVVLYMHENQLAYPALEPHPGWNRSRRARAARRDLHYPFVNLSSALAADRVWWNSAYNRDSFLAALPGFLNGFPDAREPQAVTTLTARCEIQPVGLDLASLEGSPPRARRPGPPRILWNHRWEHDKDPESFFDAIQVLHARGLDFELVLLGESFVSVPPVFEAARRRWPDRIVQFGHVARRSDYAAWLWQSDLVVSSAAHEFFGVSVCEAIACGCRPILPDRLAYPEIVPPEWHSETLYPAGTLADALIEAVSRASVAPRLIWDERLRQAMARFDWSRIAPRYDAALAAMVEAGRDPRLLY